MELLGDLRSIWRFRHIGGGDVGAMVPGSPGHFAGPHRASRGMRTWASGLAQAGNGVPAGSGLVSGDHDTIEGHRVAAGGDVVERLVVRQTLRDPVDDGLTKPRGWPASWSARAISPAQNGAAALVPSAPTNSSPPPAR